MKKPIKNYNQRRSVLVSIAKPLLTELLKIQPIA